MRALARRDDGVGIRCRATASGSDQGRQRHLYDRTGNGQRRLPAVFRVVGNGSGCCGRVLPKAGRLLHPVPLRGGLRYANRVIAARKAQQHIPVVAVAAGAGNDRPAMLVTRSSGRLVVSELSAAATRSPDPALNPRGPLRLDRSLSPAAAPTSEARIRHGLRVRGPGRQCACRPPGRVPCRCGRASRA